MTTRRIFLCGLLAGCCTLGMPAGSSADYGSPAESTSWHEPVELRFQLGKSHSFSVLCATEDYRIEAHERASTIESSADRGGAKKAGESDVSQTSSERLRHFSVSGRLISPKTCDRMLLTFQLACESSNDGSEESQGGKETQGNVATQQEHSEKSLQAEGSTLVQFGKTYTLARFGEQAITVSIGKPEGNAKQAALRKGDKVLVTFQHAASAESSPRLNITPFDVEVIGSRPNGDWAVKGRRTIRNDATTWDESLSGTIRWEDVRSDRRISSDRIADLRVIRRENRLAAPKE